MPPAEQVVKVDPHAKKKLVWDGIVAHAKELFPIILANALPGIKAKMDANPPQSEEAARSAKVDSFARAAENAFLIAQAFASARKRERGRYMADQ